MANVRFHFARPKERSIQSRQESKDFGETGEQIASRYLEEHGCVVLDRHYRHGHKEVDIIALDHGELAVVEVKTRSSDDVLSPEQAVDHQKRQNIIRVASDYVRSHHRTEPLRFDIIAIVNTDGQIRINHIKDAFNVMNY